MANVPQGRKKKYGGQGKDVDIHGQGLGTGSVGHRPGYSGRPGKTGSGGSSFQAAQSGGQDEQVTRGLLGGKGGIIIIVILAVLLLGGGGGLSGLFGNLFGGSSSGGSSSLLGNLGSMLTGGFSSSDVSTGWSKKDNTGSLDRSVASGAREKYTQIQGNGKDVVTIMVYMCGTDLESKSGMASADLQEMASATIGRNVNLLVYTGGCTKWNNNLISTRTNQIYKLENGGKFNCLVKDDGDKVMTKPATLTGFIQYCTKNYPANRYMLIFWDHGGGSLSGYGYDEKHSGSGSMTLRGINEALSAAKVKFDFIGFDACLMATLENGLMLDQYADYLIASEETEPGIGWYYKNWLSDLSNNTSMATIDIGRRIADDFVEECKTRCAGQKTTLSVVDLAELAATVPDKLTAFAVDTSELIQGDDYQKVSDARSGCREFASSSKIDQVDLVSFAAKLGTKEANELVDALLGAVKYNRTSSNMADSYGISIYFPYRKTSSVKNAVSTYDAIGMDDEYSRCIQQFAAMGSSAQQTSNAAGGLTSLFGSNGEGGLSNLLGSLGGSGDIGNILTSLLGGRTMDVEAAANYIEAHRIDAEHVQWVWLDEADSYVLALSDEEWGLVNRVLLHVFLDNGKGYIDLGLDRAYEVSDDGNYLLGQYDGTWVAIDRQPVAFYYERTEADGSDYGCVPAFITHTETDEDGVERTNTFRAELILRFDPSGEGTIDGARCVYTGEADTVAKAFTLTEGDEIRFICDYYDYNGNFIDAYEFGDAWVYSGEYDIANVTLQRGTSAAVQLTDIYGIEYWSPEIPQD